MSSEVRIEIPGWSSYSGEFGNEKKNSAVPETSVWPGGKKWACVARLGGIGDNLIAASVLGPLKKQGYMVEVISQLPYSTVFINNPYIDRLTIKEAEDIPGKGNLDWQIWFSKKAKEYAKFGNLSHSCENLIALFPASTAFWWPASARRKFCNRSYLEAVHDIMEVPYEFGPLFFPTDGEKESALRTKATVGERAIAWCLSGTRIDKMYPYTPMAIGRIIQEFDIPVVMLGAPGKNYDWAKQIQDHVINQNGSDKNLHLALSQDVGSESWPIRRILSFAQVCDMMITPDTGPAWAVAMESIPKIVLLSHASPENITKHWVNTTTLHAGSGVKCWPCHQLHDKQETCTPNKDNNGAACISDISVDRLMKAIADKWR
jgi:ADP-heptose:LPS heptosyltransferase